MNDCSVLRNGVAQVIELYEREFQVGKKKSPCFLSGHSDTLDLPLLGIDSKAIDDQSPSTEMTEQDREQPFLTASFGMC